MVNIDIAREMMAAGQTEDAYAAAQTLHLKFPKKPGPLVLMVRAQMALENLDQATSILEKVQELRPDLPSIPILQQELLRKKGDDLGVLRLALAHQDNPKVGRLARQSYLSILRNRDDLTNTQTVDAELIRGLSCIQINPMILKTLLTKAVEYTDPTVLSSLLETAANEKGPNRALAQELRLDLHQKYAEFEPIQAALRAEFVGERDLGAAKRMALAVVGLGHLSLGLRYLRRCRRKWPDDFGLLLMEINTLLRTGHYEQAIASLRTRMAQKNPQEQSPLSIHLFRTLCLNRDFTAATELRQQLTGKVDLPVRVSAMYLHQIIEEGDLPLALAESLSLKSLSSARNQAHWGLQLHSQLLTELRLMTPEYIAQIRGADFDESCAITKDNPGAIFPARRMITHWLHRTAAAEKPLRGNENDLIPKVIYQYWDKPDPPKQVANLIASWSKVQGFEHSLYDRDQAIALLRSKFGPRWVQAFRMTNNPAEESDLLRLCLLAKNGGIWADADDMLYGSLDRILSGGYGLVTYQDTVGSAVANNFIAVRPGHPAIIYAAKLARASLLQKSGESAWFRTGPGILTRAVARYITAAKPEILERDLKLVPHQVLMREISMTNQLAYKFSNAHWAQSKKDDPFYFTLLQKALETSTLVQLNRHKH